MMTSTILIAALLAWHDPSPSALVLREYREARASAGRTADAQVKLALWCEAKGLAAERVEHLSIALGLDPDHEVARALVGMVRVDGRWRSPGGVQPTDEHKELQTRYLAHRNATPSTASAQWKLATWCDKNGLKPQAEAHATAAIRLDPNHAEARKRLGYRNARGRWLTDAQIHAEARAAEARNRADRTWGAKLTRLRKTLREPGDHPVAQAELARIADPRAVRSIARVFGTEDAGDQAVMVQLLGQIDGGEASQFLATVALHAANAEVRRAAAETLIRRDPRDFVALIIAELRDLVKYEVQPGSGPEQGGILYVEGPTQIVRRRYSPPGLTAATQQLIARREANVFIGDEARELMALQSGRPGLRQIATDVVNQRRDQEIVNAQQRVDVVAASARRQLERDVAILDQQNATATEMNSRALTVLTLSTGADFPADRLVWTRWWTDRQGYAFVAPASTTRKPIVDFEVPLDSQRPIRTSHACFAAGTLVHTREGLRAIESLRVGDEVLAQNVQDGRMGFEPVLMAHHNPPAETLEVKLAQDTIVATGIHRFWVAGKGWTMARDLRPGDLIRTVGSTSAVKSITSNAVQPVFNLEVARARSFFVGEHGALVHDHSLVDPTPEPFDAATRNSDTTH